MKIVILYYLINYNNDFNNIEKNQVIKPLVLPHRGSPEKWGNLTVRPSSQ